MDGITNTNQVTGTDTQTTQTGDNAVTQQSAQTTQTTQPTQTAQQLPDNQVIDIDSLPDDDKPVLTKKQVSQIIRQRVNKLNPYKKAIENIARATGLDEKVVLEYIQQQLNPQFTNPAMPVAQPQPQTQPHQVYPVNDQYLQLARAAGQVALETKRQVELSELKQNPLYSDMFNDEEKKEAVLAHANSLGISIKEAYWQLYGEQRAAALQKEAEQRTLANIQNRAGLSAEGDYSANELEKLDLTPEEASFYKNLGYDLKEVAALKKMSNVGDIEKFYKSQKK